MLMRFMELRLYTGVMDGNHFVDYLRARPSRRSTGQDRCELVFCVRAPRVKVTDLHQPVQPDRVVRHERCTGYHDPSTSTTRQALIPLQHTIWRTELRGSPISRLSLLGILRYRSSSKQVRNDGTCQSGDVGARLNCERG